MNKQLLKNAFVWGGVVWLFGYILGILLFAFVPSSVIGWVIMPFGVAFTLWVLLTRVRVQSFADFHRLAVVWTLIAIVGDYLSSSKRFTRLMVITSWMCIFTMC